jgi:hypothetical protein
MVVNDGFPRNWTAVPTADSPAAPWLLEHDHLK